MEVEPSGICILRWTAPPGGADYYEVSTNGHEFLVGDRPVSHPDGTATQVRMDFSETLDLTEIELQMRSFRGDERSAFSPMIRFALPVRPVLAFSALRVSAGVRLQWRVHGKSAATMVEIERSELNAQGVPGTWSQIAALPSSPRPPGDYSDPALEVGKRHAYRISAVRQSDRSASQLVTTVALGTPLQSSTRRLPQAPEVADDGNGNFAFADRANPIRFTWRRGDEWVTTEREGDLSSPGIMLDASGRPHAVYGRNVANDEVQIIHGWSDGTQWLEETIAQRPFRRGFDGRIALDASGAPVVVWHLGLLLFEVATHDNGMWSTTRLDDVVPRTLLTSSYTVFVDQSGAPHLLFYDSASAELVLRVEHVERAPNGAWVRDSLPLESITAINTNAMTGVGRDPSHLTICFDIVSVSQLARQAACIRKSPSGWGTVEVLGTLRPGAALTPGISARAALSSDGSRVAVTYHGSSAHLFRSENGGRWSETVLGSPSIRAAGFDSGNRYFATYVLQSNPSDPEAEYHFETE